HSRLSKHGYRIGEIGIFPYIAHLCCHLAKRCIPKSTGKLLERVEPRPQLWTLHKSMRQLDHTLGNDGLRHHSPNEKEISHGRVSWQTRWSCIEMGPLASSSG